MSSAAPLRIFDSHVHFVDPIRLEYPWMADVPALRRYWGPAEYAAAIGALPIQALVFVEVTARPEQAVLEVQWVEELTRTEPRVQGIVARAELTDPRKREPQLDELRTHPAVRGVRDIIQWQGPGYCCQPAYIEGAKRAAALGFHVELCIFHPQLGDVLELVRAAPDVPFVLNHCGKPGIKAGAWEPWAARLRELGRLPNVHCKLSALLTEADHEHWQASQVVPYIEHAAECFGVERLMFGGDWPVLTLAGSYSDWLRVVQQATRSFDERERDAMFYANAARFYARPG